MSSRTGLRPGGDPAGYQVDGDGGLIRRSSVAGRSLDALLVDGPIEIDEGLRILRSAALAVDSVRWSGRGFHGRLSPRAIVIDDEDQSVAVLGFGTSDLLMQDSGSSAAARYVAPELLEGASGGAAADTYSLGCILFEVLTGERPGRQVASPAELELPEGLDEVFKTALAHEPESRYSTCVELLMATDAAFSGEGSVGVERPLREPEIGFVTKTEPVSIPLAAEDGETVAESGEVRDRSARKGHLVTLAIALGVVGFLSAMVALDSGRSNEATAPIDGSADVSSEPVTTVTGASSDDGTVAATVSPGSEALYPSSSGANSVVRIDGQTGQIEQAIPVGTGLQAIEAGEEALWALSAGDGTITKIDATTDEVLESIQVDGVPAAGVAVPGRDAVWVVNARNGQLIEIRKRDFGAGHSQSPFAVGSPPALLTTGPTSLVMSDYAAWVAVPAGSGNSTRLVRIAKSSKEPTAVAAGGRRPTQLALGGGSLWTGDREGVVRRLNPTTLETLAEIDVGGFVAGMVWADDALWVSACDSVGGLIAVVDATTDTVVRRSRARSCSFGIDAGFGSIWVASPSHERIVELDPSNASILSLIPVNGRPVDLAVSERGIYVALGTD